MAGGGAQGAGGSNGGLGTPNLATPQPGRLFRDDRTGGALQGRLIDPGTKQYALDDRGRVLGMTKAQQLVLIAVTTDIGSSAVREIGNRLKTIKTIGRAFANELRQVYVDAFARIVNQGAVELVDIEARRVGTTGAYVRVKWKDLSTNEIHTTDT